MMECELLLQFDFYGVFIGLLMHRVMRFLSYSL